jgi:hypothetical protein
MLACEDDKRKETIEETPMTDHLVNEKESSYGKKEMTKHMLVIIPAITIIVGGLTALTGWITGWQTAVQFSNGLFVAGSAVGLLGLLAVLGTYRARANFGIQYSQSTSDMNLSERTKLWVKDINQGYNALIVGVVSGALLIGLAILVDKIFA